MVLRRSRLVVESTRKREIAFLFDHRLAQPVGRDGGREAVVEQEGDLVPEGVDRLSRPRVAVAVRVGEGGGRVPERVDQCRVRVGHLGPDLVVAAPGQARVGVRVVADRDPGRLQRAQLGPPQVGDTRRGRRRDAPKVRDGGEALVVGYLLESSHEGGPLARGERFHLGPPVGLVGVEQAGDDERGAG